MSIGDGKKDLRERLYSAYSTTHAGVAERKSAVWSFRRDVLPHLPPNYAASLVDLGCGQGQLVRLLTQAGYVNARGIDISPEQVELAHRAGISQVVLGDYREGFGERAPEAIIATDFFEHLDKHEALDGIDRVFRELAPQGSLIMRVPNSVSPFAGNYRDGDITHETSFTASSLRQLGAAVGFAKVSAYACAPPVHGLASLARRSVWSMASGVMKLVIASETGELRGHLVTQNIVAVMHKS